ncbi:hypothetical protein [Actinoplanes derwentensis]|uniref:hypothetical protein n=1 Tax=Actinoplanes derwentensis TaxID=113562 RepID=UPI0012FD564E|nr:hypothetical protein [Actinoplanes derwentensis]
MLLKMYREPKAACSDGPVAAWADVVCDPVKSHRHKSELGKGGLVRATPYVVGLRLPPANAASTLLLTLTAVRRTAHRHDEEMSLS